MFIIGNITVLPTKSLYLSSSGCTAIPVSPSIVSGLVVATITNFSCSLFTGYLTYHKCVGSSSYSTSASEIEVLQYGHQLIILLPLYIKPFSYRLTNTWFTAFDRPSSIVNLSLDQSQEQPNFLS